MLITTKLPKPTKAKKSAEKLSKVWEKLPEEVKKCLKLKLTQMVAKKIDMSARKKEDSYE